jgi:hypothetical protein
MPKILIKNYPSDSLALDIDDSSHTRDLQTPLSDRAYKRSHPYGIPQKMAGENQIPLFFNPEFLRIFEFPMENNNCSETVPPVELDDGRVGCR